MAFPRADRVLVCGRIGDPWCRPVPGSVRLECADCGAAVMAAPQSAVRHEIGGLPIVCVPCVARSRAGANPTILIRE